MPLYKYVTAERIDVLQNELIRFTQPGALNDPWDMRPYVEKLITDNDLERIATPLTQQSDDQLIDYVSEIIENISKTHNLGDKSLEEIKQVVIEANREFPGELRQLYEGVFGQALETMKQFVPEALDLIPEAIDKAAGVLSLTENPAHPLMWSHYANNHSGLILAFDETHQFFKSPRYDEPDDMGSPRRVKYSSQRPTFNPLVDLSIIDNMTDQDAIRWMDGMFFTKSQEWEYESEWRMIKGLKKANKVVQTPNGNVYLFSIPSECIVSVVLGQRMLLETRRQVIQFITTDKRYAHVTVFEARPSANEFTIELQPVRLRYS
jgi:hypothetical protein